MFFFWMRSALFVFIFQTRLSSLLKHFHCLLPEISWLIRFTYCITLHVCGMWELSDGRHLTASLALIGSKIAAVWISRRHQQIDGSMEGHRGNMPLQATQKLILLTSCGGKKLQRHEEISMRWPFPHFKHFNSMHQSKRKGLAKQNEEWSTKCPPNRIPGAAPVSACLFSSLLWFGVPLAGGCLH